MRILITNLTWFQMMRANVAFAEQVGTANQPLLLAGWGTQKYFMCFGNQLPSDFVQEKPHRAAFVDDHNLMQPNLNCGGDQALLKFMMAQLKRKDHVVVLGDCVAATVCGMLGVR